MMESKLASELTLSAHILSLQGRPLYEPSRPCPEASRDGRRHRPRGIPLGEVGEPACVQGDVTAITLTDAL